MSFSTIVKLQLEDTASLAASTKGKQREGTISDAELALQLYNEDLQACQNILNDRQMAQSIA